MKTEHGDTICIVQVGYPQPGTLSVEVESCDWSKATGLLTPTEARRLAAELVRAANAIEVDPAISRTEIVRMLTAEGCRVTERQLRYWAKKGAIPKPIVRQRAGASSPEALFRPGHIAAIRAIAAGKIPVKGEITRATS